MDKDGARVIKYVEDPSRCKKGQEEKQRKKMKRTGNEKAKGNNSNGTKLRRSMRCKVSKQNQRVNKKSKRTKHNPPSSKLSKRKEAAPKGGKRI